jgi:hypothetical protein
MNALVGTPKISKLIPLLGSDKDGEIVAAAKAIGRTLRATGCDWHDLASLVVSPPRVPGTGGSQLDCKQMAEWCLRNAADRMTERERAFVANMGRTWAHATDRQADWLEAIYRRLWSERRP